MGSLIHIGSDREVTAALARQIDLIKVRGIMAMLTSLTDTWLLLRNLESDGERNRLLFVIGPHGVLTGSARELQQGRQQSAAATLETEVERRRVSLQRRRESVEAQIAALQHQLQAEGAAFDAFVAEQKRRAAEHASNQLGSARQRGERR